MQENNEKFAKCCQHVNCQWNSLPFIVSSFSLDRWMLLANVYFKMKQSCAIIIPESL